MSDGRFDFSYDNDGGRDIPCRVVVSGCWPSNLEDFAGALDTELFWPPEYFDDENTPSIYA